MAIALFRKTEKIKGGAVLSRMLAAEGVEQVFGIIDGTYLGMLASFEGQGISLVTPRHETSAAHMAGAYARLTGKLGVCIASNGPGVANILPGVAVENAEGNRVLLITSSRREGIAYPDRGGTFQYFPQTDVTSPMSKWSGTVPSVERLAEMTRRALRHCFTGRPGVVHLDVPESIMNGSYELDPTWFRDPSQYRNVEPMQPRPAQVALAATMLFKAKRPLIHAGSGIIHAHAHAELQELAELLDSPITTSWGARCAVDERREQVIPMPYVDTVTRARVEADLVLCLGSRLGETDWWGKAPYWGTPDKQKLIQVDIDADILGCNRITDLAVQADVKVFLQELIAQVRGTLRADQAPQRRSWIASLRKDCDKRRAELDVYLKNTSAPMASAHVATVCDMVFQDDDIMIVDGGNTAIWANFFHEVRAPHTVVTTPKMGMLGAGVSQALGAQVACPDKTVFCVIGDGAMGFHQQEIETAVRNNLNVIYMVLCDRQWGMVKINQQFGLKPLKTLLMRTLSEEETINTDLSETRFDLLAQAMGAHGERVAEPGALPGAIERCRAAGRCSVIHIDVDRVNHLWAPNLMTFKEMHAEPAGV